MSRWCNYLRRRIRSYTSSKRELTMLDERLVIWGHASHNTTVSLTSILEALIFKRGVRLQENLLLLTHAGHLL